MVSTTVATCRPSSRRRGTPRSGRRRGQRSSRQSPRIPRRQIGSEDIHLAVDTGQGPSNLRTQDKDHLIVDTGQGPSMDTKIGSIYLWT